MDGKTVRMEYSALVDNKDYYQIDIRNLNSGIYIIKVIDNSEHVIAESLFLIVR